MATPSEKLTQSLEVLRAFQANPTDMRAALSMVRDASEVLGRLLEGGHSKIAGRLAGMFRSIGRDRISADIINTMRQDTVPFTNFLASLVDAGLKGKAAPELPSS